MLLVRTSAPASFPITRVEAKAQLVVDHSDDDAYIDALIGAATTAVEQMTGRPLITQTWAMSFQNPPALVRLPKLPVQSVSSIAYFDRDNASQTATVSDFYLMKDDEKAWLEPKSGSVWPQTYDRDDAITVTFVCGYGGASDVPSPLSHAIKMLVSHWYENREVIGDRVLELPYAIESLVGLYRLGWAA